MLNIRMIHDQDKIDDDVIDGFEKYKIDGREFFNPFNGKAIYKNQKNWRLWLSRTIGRDKTNQFLYMLEPPKYSIYSNTRLGLECFLYYRNGSWLSGTKEEIENKTYIREMVKNRSKKYFKNERVDLSMEDCVDKLSSFWDGVSYMIPNNNKIFKNKTLWKCGMRKFYTKNTTHKLSYLSEPPTYSKYSGKKLTFDDYDYDTGFGLLYSKDEIKNKVWTKLRIYSNSKETRVKISDSLQKFYSSPASEKTRKKQSENTSNFFKTDKGRKQKQENALNHSKTMKEKIRKGEFTPNITNSWTHWDATITIDDISTKFRSSWEACFWFCNQHLKYETIRIKRENNDRIFMNDFYDEDNNILYELKPKNRYNIEIDKMETLRDFCLKENIKFMWINEFNILDYISEDKIFSNESAKKQFEKLKKGLKYVKDN